MPSKPKPSPAVVIGGITMSNYDASRMAWALREQRKTMTEEAIVDYTSYLMPGDNPREKALQIIKDLDDKVNNKYRSLTDDEKKLLDAAGFSEE
jgi:hypothetical protein